MRSNSTTKKPAATTDRAAKSIVTEEKIRAMVSRLLINDDDAQAQALVALTQMIADERDFTDRDYMTFVVRSAAFAYTMEFSNACNEFARKAKLAHIGTAG
jgi:hypothetical protein